VHEPAEVARTAVRVPAGGRADLTLVMPDTPVALLVDDDGAGTGLRLVPPGQTPPSTVDNTARWPELDLSRYGTPTATPFDATSVYAASSPWCWTRANNPGVWMNHCHNLPHAERGMAVHLVDDGYRTPYAGAHHA
jgi:Putative multicopper oxidases